MASASPSSPRATWCGIHWWRRSCARTNPPNNANPMPAIELHISYGAVRRGVPTPASFRLWIEAALRTARYRKAAEVSLRIVGAREGRAVNHRYRGRDYATNVLSFPAELPQGIKSPLLGDIVICAPFVAREAREQGKSVRDHYAHLTVHGVLHLLGFDHQNEGDATKMEAL